MWKYILKLWRKLGGKPPRPPQKNEKMTGGLKPPRPPELNWGASPPDPPRVPKGPGAKG